MAVCVIRETSSVQGPASRVQCSESSVQSPESRVQHPESSVQSLASRVQEFRYALYWVLFAEMIDWHWHLIVSSPSNQENSSFNWPMILLDLLLRQFFWQSQRNKFEIKLRRYVRRHYFSSFVLNHNFIEEDNPSEKVVIVEEELNRVDIDDIGNLENLPRFLFIDEECGNLKVVNDSGELPRNINQKKKSDVSQ